MKVTCDTDGEGEPMQPGDLVALLTPPWRGRRPLLLLTVVGWPRRDLVPCRVLRVLDPACAQAFVPGETVQVWRDNLSIGQAWWLTCREGR